MLFLGDNNERLLVSLGLTEHHSFYDQRIGIARLLTNLWKTVLIYLRINNSKMVPTIYFKGKARRL